MPTVMAEAFIRAGHKPKETARERLRYVMRAAIRSGGGLMDRSCGHFLNLLTQRWDQGELLWDLNPEPWDVPIKALYRDVLEEMREEFAEAPVEDDVLKGQTATTGGLGETNAAESVVGSLLPQGQFRSTPTQPQREAGGGTVADAVLQGRTNGAEPPPRPTRTATRPSYTEVARLKANSMLDRFRRIKGQALRDVEIGDAREWLHLEERDAGYVRLLLDRIGPLERGRIGDYIDDVEANECWMLANERALTAAPASS